jgi:hypothetical protein
LAFLGFLCLGLFVRKTTLEILNCQVRQGRLEFTDRRLSDLPLNPGQRRNRRVQRSQPNLPQDELATGQAGDTNGPLIHQSDVHASVLESMGLSYDPLSNQSPQIIAALLK